MINRLSGYQIRVLRQLIEYTRKLGVTLDMTAAHPNKLQDRSQAHTLVSNTLVALMGDTPDNPYRDQEKEIIDANLQKLRVLSTKNYLDRDGR